MCCRRVFRVIPFLFFFLVSSIANAVEVISKDDWRNHQSLYLMAGYLLSHSLDTHEPLSFAPPKQSTINYTPNNTYPKNFNGLRLGLGWTLPQDKSLVLEFAYTQLFNNSRTTPQIQAVQSGKSLSSILFYEFNPESRLRIAALGGASINSSYTTLNTVSPRAFATLTSNSVDVDPVMGLTALYQVNARMAIRLTGVYDYAAYNRVLTGRLIPLLIVNYYPK